MALVSPGLQLTVTDESQYVPAAVGSVPLVLLATSQDKTINNGAASGTSKANAGALQAFTSQRELVAALGYPTFQQSAAGTPLHADELNEYGLMAAYSTLGLGNRVYAIRADIDLNQLQPTAARPIGKVSNGTYWLDLTNTSWGINEWNATTGTFTTKTPLIITNLANDTTLIGSAYVPKSSIGTIGSYAVVVGEASNRIYIKNGDNNWVQVGSSDWQYSWPSVINTVASPTLPSFGQLNINGIEITVTTGTTLADVVTAINTAMSGKGVKAALTVNNIAGNVSVLQSPRLAIYADSTAKSGGDAAIADGALNIRDGANNPCLTALGITAGIYNGPALSFGSYVDVPSWRSTDTSPRPSGSVYVKTSVLGSGMNLVVKEYNSDADAWTTLAAPVYDTEETALLGIDPAGGGYSIGAGTVFGKYSVFSSNQAGVRLFYRTKTGVTKATVTPTGAFTAGNKFTLGYSKPGAQYLTRRTVTLSGSTAADFVASITALNMPYVSAQVESTGAISIIHSTGGNIVLEPVAGQGTPLTTAGFNSSNTRIDANGYFVLSNWAPLTYTYSLYEPYQNPIDGTLWFYGSATDVDIMVNDGGWKGYRNVASDARGYNLGATDPNGVLVSPSRPVVQSDGTALAPGDLWLDSGDLENYPKLYRYNANSQWVAINNTDRVSQNGVVFADARWDSEGTTDVVTGSLPTVAALTTSNYTDLDAPDYRLYPRGTLLFNTRRSGYNVKQYVSNYFNSDSFPNASLPTIKATWVTASGNKDSGAPFMGKGAQRNMVVKALRSAIDGNTQIREDQFIFNLIVAPGYPELIPNMVALNNDRANTAFVIGDTPMTLPANTVSIANWSSNVNGDGIATADPYLGVFYPSGLTNDVQGNTIAVPSSHMALRTFIRSDNVSYPWFAPAGTRRGLIDNSSDIGYVNGATGGFIKTGINQGLRDSLYENRINPITVLPGVGLVSWGQKTRGAAGSAMDRINVARLVNYIRTILDSVGNSFLFEPNDKVTRDQIKQIIEGAMNDLIAKRGIYDYLVVCDTSNNTPERIARNELYVDIAIEPMKDVEFIYIPIRLKNPGDIAKLGK